MKTYLGRLGELVLKGSNIRDFERLLMGNARRYLQSVDAKVSLYAGRLYIECEDNAAPAVEFALDHLIGITGWSEAAVVEKNIDAIREEVLREAVSAREKGAKTFKIEAKRSDKSFYLDTYGICREAPALVCQQDILAVDVHNPDVSICVELRDRCFVYSNKNKGHRGLPVGSSGKGLLLLSGGLDSPVAGYRMMSRGMKIECCYFHAYPYTSEEAQKKVEKLAEILASYGLTTHINVIPFTDVQMRIKQRSPANFTTLMLRMCMMQCANLLAERLGADCIVTGESLGQVASQTIQNMAVTESMAKYPLLRPLVGTDKEDIIATANFIGTYETSILPYEDCCVLFSPRHPVLHADLEEAKKIYESLEAEDLIREAYEKREIKRYDCAGMVAEKYGTRENTAMLASENGKKLTGE
ncbi:MAG: tRNA 4-thiouridine(8) synthase ThiI [Treponema sp.]|nr:tRNA 4-thiouridine(8) synthase ThiI [Treponema sp.]MBR4464564.1 tRNA 4-thiouridine(8) synthase ThiI [Treponema sp.]